MSPKKEKRDYKQAETPSILKFITPKLQEGVPNAQTRWTVCLSISSPFKIQGLRIPFLSY
jgi:hypothetical protein